MSLNKIDTLKIQIESDRKILKEDMDAGLYSGRIVELNTELEKIRHKEVLLEQLQEEDAILLEENTDYEDKHRLVEE
jgi:hypothetical protein